MTKRTSSFALAAVLAASGLALQAYAADNSQSSDKGVPGVEMNAGKNASDKGVPGVEMNVGRDGDQKNIDTSKSSNSTSTLGAGADTSGSSSTMRPMRTDRN